MHFRITHIKKLLIKEVNILKLNKIINEMLNVSFIQKYLKLIVKLIIFKVISSSFQT